MNKLPDNIKLKEIGHNERWITFARFESESATVILRFTSATNVYRASVYDKGKDSGPPKFEQDIVAPSFMEAVALAGNFADNFVPVTGVLHTHNAEWIYDEAHNGVDLASEQFTADFDEPDWDEFYSDSSDCLIGFKECGPDDEPWFAVVGEVSKSFFKPDINAEYSAIVRGDSGTTQVVLSHYAAPTAPCSPCYPGQGDLDTPGNLIAYCLPPDVYGSYEQPKGMFRLSKEQRQRAIKGV